MVLFVLIFYVLVLIKKCIPGSIAYFVLFLLQVANHFSNQPSVLLGSNSTFDIDKGQHVGFTIQVVHLYEVSFLTVQLPLKFVRSDRTDYQLNQYR